ncbi:FHA domain-containing protein [Amycolatopsis sp. NPDC049253]|uniref:FHA domain-containing protein n=1 Tax=Amycolatopsis sp. NPDC049253 TaxID=3155274 RepID=UPI0034394665
MTGEGMQALPAGHPSLARGFASPPGTLVVLGLAGGVLVPPSEPGPVTFGRNTAEVAVPVGEDDRRVSRRHGLLEHHRDRWWVRATGKVPLRLPESRLLFAGAAPVALAAGYLPLFVHGSGGREHVLEVHVADGRPVAPPVADAVLDARERLALTAVGQSFLRWEAQPRPVPPERAAAQLAVVDPGGEWTPLGVRAAVDGVRARFHPAGGDDRLLGVLLAAAVLVPPDLALLTADPVPRPRVPDWTQRTVGS